MNAAMTLGMPMTGVAAWAPKRRGIWLKSAWLGDEIEHQRDQWTLNALLAAMDGVPTGERFQSLLKKAVALFRLHVLIEARLHATPELRALTDHLFTLVEQVERNVPEDPLYLSQSAALRFGIELTMSMENELRAAGVADYPSNPDPVLLHARSRLLEEAWTLLRSAATARMMPTSESDAALLC